MSIHVALTHITTYQYDKFINLGPQIIRLRPAPHTRTPVLNYSLQISPNEHFINWQQDPQSNYLARVVFTKPTDHFHVCVDLGVDMTVINPFDFFLEESAKSFPFQYESWLKKELKPFLIQTKQAAIFKDYLANLPSKDPVTIDYLVDLNMRLNRDIGYLIRLEPGVQTPEETLEKRSGSCRDSAWLLVNLLRHQGLAARFVSGYLIQLRPDVQPLDGPSGAEKDFTDLHAWTEVYLPGAGWVGLDPTSGLLTGEGHIPLVATPDPSSAAPITGRIEPCQVDFNHQMTVHRFFETPRVTKPYTEEQWQAIQSIGEQLDESFKMADIRLTMGGEPTFVSSDDMESEQWNTHALGDEKRRLAQTLFDRLKKSWSTGALMYIGYGKWYPGEPLPRWVLACYWRKDQVPIWQDDKWLADECQDYGLTQKHAQAFIKTLANELSVDPQYVIPAFEDVWYHLWKENRLSVNVDPLQSKLKDPLERARLAKIFKKQLGEALGYALPLRCQHQSKVFVWQSAPWTFRTEHMFLVPGDSPMGLRLPLDSLPWAEAKDLPQIHERDPLVKVEKLETTSSNESKAMRKQKYESHQSYPVGVSACSVVRTALCVEARNGRLYVFLPPLEKIEEYLNLIQYIEKTAAQLQWPVVIEGYHPPYDSRIDCFKVTPDPGVIEVNLPPVADWSSLVKQTLTIYEQARLSHLGTEKFMLDGKHTGTGGGNHIVLGGPTPRESPFLRRPDLLASLLAYWHNHPSLSYFFSGQFVGPTSQSPRVDEGRADSLYELELAINEVRKQSQKNKPCPPWLVDRIFRHLLVDGTGNTHRAEFCIDKLYSPDSATGRLGLLELRNFEMPSDPKMSLTQSLLIRALVVKFWNEPYHTSLVRWGTSLHDRFLLPHFVGFDFQDVLADIQASGVDLLWEYFTPQFEFRFPQIGSVTYAGVTLELRTAIEPWYVLGEEPAGGGMSRFVDSSLERLQVLVRGLSGNRYQIRCNDHVIPIQPTGVEGEAVAGVRYRAWQPASCLHPTIPVHTPLTFDIVDTWNQRSIGGCRYHVAHPGGRNYDTFPVNAFEAQARRQTRFFKMGHIQGEPRSSIETSKSSEFPFTFDLRRFS